MSTNKNAQLRYQVLDKCFRNPGRRYFINDLLDECNNTLYEYEPNAEGIKKRQLYEDIRFMESPQGWSAPIERIKSGRRTYLRYEDINFSINNQPINDSEAEQLKSAMLVLSRFKGLPQFNWVNELLPKLDQSFNLTTQSGNIMSFDNNEFLEGLEHISELFKAIQFRQSLKVAYKSFKKEEEDSFDFHPYHLKQYNNRWFVFGKRNDFTGLTNLALDRIKEVKHSSLFYDDSQTVDFEEFFEDIIGVSKPEGSVMEKVVLKSTVELAPYIKTKPLHGSQKRISDDDTGYTFSIEVIPNFELEKTILAYGEELLVLEPKNIRDKIHQRIIKNKDNYK